MQGKKLALGTILAGALIVPSTAMAKPPLQPCKGGSLMGKWITGKESVAMTATTAAGIARLVGPGEFGQSIPVSAVPCAVANSATSSASKAYAKIARRWPSQPYRPFWTGVTWIGYSTGPYLGAFHCAVTNGGGFLPYTKSEDWRVTCTHTATDHEGAVVVRFLIGAYDPNGV